MKFLNCTLFLLISGVIVFFIGRFFPRKWIKEESFPFKDFKFEQKGKLYDKIHIKQWKTKLPDASLIIGKFFPKFMPKKRIEGDAKNKIKTLIKESCVAESTHFLCAIIGLYCAKIWKFWGVIISVIWAVWHSLFIVIQRYNRPRLIATDKNYKTAFTN